MRTRWRLGLGLRLALAAAVVIVARTADLASGHLILAADGLAGMEVLGKRPDAQSIDRR